MSDPDEAEQFAMQLDDECVELDARDRAVLNHERTARLIRERDAIRDRQAAAKEKARCIAACRQVVRGLDGIYQADDAQRCVEAIELLPVEEP